MYWQLEPVHHTCEVMASVVAVPVQLPHKEHEEETHEAPSDKSPQQGAQAEEHHRLLSKPHD